MKKFNSILLVFTIMIIASCNLQREIYSSEKRETIKSDVIGKVVDGKVITNRDFDIFLASLEKQLKLNKITDVNLTANEIHSSKIISHDIFPKEDHILLSISFSDKVSKIRLALDGKKVIKPIVLTLCSASKYSDTGYPGDCICYSATENTTKTCIRGLK